MIVASLEVAFHTHFGKSPSRPALIAGIGTPLVQQLEHHAIQFGFDDPNLVQALMDSYLSDNLARHDHEMKIFPNAKEVIIELVERGHRLTIVTSKPVKTARRGLRLFGLDDVFKLCVGCDTVTKHKPDPEPVLFAMDALNVEARDVLFIGDSTHDILSGQRAGVATAGVLWGPYPKSALEAVSPTYLLEEFHELLG